MPTVEDSAFMSAIMVNIVRCHHSGTQMRMYLMLHTYTKNQTVFLFFIEHRISAKAILSPADHVLSMEYQATFSYLD